MKRVPLALASLASVAAATTVASCGNGRDIVVGDDYQTVLDPLPASITKVDVVVVIETSPSVQAEREAFIAAAGESLFAQLSNDLGELPDLHIGIVTTDVSPGIPSVPGCPSEGSPDGRFLVGWNGTTCPMISGVYLEDRPDGAGGRITNFDGTIADAFQCAASVGTSGCGFEQPLEAMRRALDGRYPEHAGFLRPDALLLIVFLVDEDDCSAFDSAVYGSPDATADSPLGPRDSFRCFEFGVVCDDDQPREFGTKTGCVPREDSPYMTPVSEFRELLASLKTEPSLVMIAGVMGPTEPLVVGPHFQDASWPSLVHTCAFTPPDGTVGTTPPIRLTALGESFPSRFVFEDLCEATTASERLRRVTRATTGVMSRRPCLLGKVGPNTTTERCRAFDAVGTTRTPVEGCEGAESNCFTVAPSAECDYTPSGFAASYRGTLADGHRLVVECLPDMQ